jgi:hypothetical protein
MGSHIYARRRDHVAWDMKKSKIIAAERTNEWHIAGPSVVLIAAWFAFALPWLVGTLTIPWDGKAQFAPQIQFMAASFARGEWPWWTPNVFAGHPQIADPQSMLFSPPFVLLALIEAAPTPWQIDLVVLLMLLAAALGTLWLARDFGWHWPAALIAALGLAFGAAMAWRLQHFGQVLSLAYLPFTLIFLRRAILYPSIGHGALAGLFAAFIVLGRDQVGLLSIYLLSGYAVSLLLDRNGILQRIRGALLPLVSGALVAAALVAIPILLTIALAAQSNRPAIDYQEAAAGSLHPALLITSLVPHLFGAAGEMRNYWGPPSFHWEGTGLYLAQNMGVVYIGAPALLLLILGTARGWLFERDIRFFAVSWVLILLYALGWYTPIFQVMYAVLPGVSFYRRPADAVFLLGGLGSLLAGYVLHRLLQECAAGGGIGRRIAGTVGVSLALLFAIAISFAVMTNKLPAAAPALLVALAWMALAAAALSAMVWLMSLRPVLAGMILVAAMATDLLVNNGPNGASALPSATLDMMEPDRRNITIAKLKSLAASRQSATRRPRIEMVGLGYHWPNTALTHDLHSTLGANPVRLDHYVRATGAGDTVAEGRQRVFPALFPSYRSTLANVLGLRFIVTAEPIEKIDPMLATGTFEKVAQHGRMRIYENKATLPRVIFAAEAETANFDEIMRTGKWPLADLRTAVLLETVLAPNLQRRPGKIAIASYRNTVVKLTVDSPDGGWAVLNDVWHPWWRGAIDGKAVPVVKANVIFRAIKVPPGRHTVQFEFRPIAGAWTDLFSAQPSNAAQSRSQRPAPTQ